METDRHKWNTRYREQEFPGEPSPVVTRFAHLANKGRALDIACGMGRNALFLAKQGFRVDAVDISDVALQQLQKYTPQIRCIQADLDSYSIPPATYDLIININFLQRRLFPEIIAGLRPGGILIFETFVNSEYEAAINNPVNPDYLLKENELLHAFLSLKIVYYEEKLETRCKDKPRMIAILVAQKGKGE